MSVSIVACPSCGTILLHDTVQCPKCRHVLDSDRATLFAEVQDATGGRSALVEDPCPNCYEMVHRGLVRCWNCGTFMRQEIAEAYRQLLASPSRVSYNPIPVGVISQDKPDHQAESTHEKLGAVDKFLSDDADFELSSEAMSSESFDEGGFELQSEFEPEGPLLDPPDFNAVSAASAQTLAPVSEEPSAQPEVPIEPKNETSIPLSDASLADEPEVAHSVATGGDVLLRVALEEEAAQGRRRPTNIMKSRNGILVFCPNGHRVEVQEKHRGKSGRCPKCKAPFFVPEEAWDTATSKASTLEGETAGATTRASCEAAAGGFTGWMTDIRLHTVNPAKLKLKPGSLQNAFQPVDLGFSPEGLLSAILLKKVGPFRAGDQEKVVEVRKQMLAHLSEGKSLDEFPAAEHTQFDVTTIEEIRVAHPTRYEHESMFAGVPVFGESRIAVRLPKTDKNADPQFASFTLSEFRRFASIRGDAFNLYGLGEDSGIPLIDTFNELKCHFSDQSLNVLQQADFYQADPEFKLELIGRCCQGCGLAISEDSRKKEKIGGASVKGIAKAKCPKCKQKFGNVLLYTLESPATDEQSTENAVAEATN